MGNFATCFSSIWTEQPLQAIYIVGAILNALCIVCWSFVLRSKSAEDRVNSAAAPLGNMFEYLLVKAVCDCFYFLSEYLSTFWNTYGPLNQCLGYTCGTLVYEIFRIYIFGILTNAVNEFSSLLEVVATLDCLLAIKQRLRFALTKKAFYVISIGLFAFSFGLQAYQFWRLYIELISNSHGKNVTTGNVTKYVIKSYSYYAEGLSAFSDTNASLILGEVDFLGIRDVVCTFLILIFNLFILWEIRKITKRRKELAGFGDNEQQVTDSDLAANQSVRKALNKAEHKKTIMILLTGLNYSLGHVGFIVVNAIGLFGYISSISYFCIMFLSYDLLPLSYATPFFFYYFFNSHFKNTANQFFYPMIFLYRKFKPHQVNDGSQRGRSASRPTATSSGIRNLRNT